MVRIVEYSVDDSLINALCDSFSIPTNEAIVELCLNKVVIKSNFSQNEILLKELISSDFLETVTDISLADIEKYFWFCEQYNYEILIEYFNKLFEPILIPRLIEVFVMHNIMYERRVNIDRANLDIPLSDKLIELLQCLYSIILYRELAIVLLVEQKDISCAISMSHLAVMSYARLSYAIEENFGQQFISEQNKKNADKRWIKHNQIRTEKKRQYLQIMQEKGFTSYADTVFVNIVVTHI
jgi:hypothetical protein